MTFWRERKNLTQKPIEPDEIFLDSTNSPGFERELFEGRLESPLPSKIFYAALVIFLAGVLAAAVQLANLQIFNADEYLARAKNNTLIRVRVPSERGLIYDRDGVELAWNSSEGRTYWSGEGLSHILGYVSYPEEITNEISPQTKIGKAGIEGAYDSVLRGRDGSRLVEEGADGAIFSQSIELEPQDGKNVFLTIDAEMQSALFSGLKNVVEERGFRAGSAVVLDTETGEILAAPSFPEFDSEVLSKGEAVETIESYFKNNAQPFFFRAFEGLYTPGSVFKPIVALAALAEKIISPDKQIFSSGSISIPNPYFPDKFSVFYDWKAHGWVSMREAIAVSSNVYFYTIGGGFEEVEGLGVRKITDYAGRMGLGSKVGVELNEAEGFLPTPEWKEKNSSDPVWRVGDTYNLSIGQGALQVTPIQMASVVSLIANNGVLSDIHLVKDGAGESAKNTKANIPADAFEIVREGMRRAAEHGTASALSRLGVTVAGKTGTAEIGSLKNSVNSWFIGFMPYEKPKISLAIVLEAGDAQNLVGGVFVAREFILWLMENRPELAGL